MFSSLGWDDCVDMRSVSFAQEFTVAVGGCSAHGGVPCVAVTAKTRYNGHKAALLVTLNDLVHVSLDG
jgi:Ni,Fe-hydrogenase I small subunit